MNHAISILAFNPQVFRPGTSDGHDHGVVLVVQLLQADIAAQGLPAEKADTQGSQFGPLGR